MGKSFLPNGTFSKPFEHDESHLGHKSFQLRCAPLLPPAWFHCSLAEQAAMSEKAMTVKGLCPQWQLGIARGGKSSNVSVSLPEEAHTIFCERPTSLESPGYGRCGWKPPECQLTAGQGWPPLALGRSCVPPASLGSFWPGSKG